MGQAVVDLPDPLDVPPRPTSLSGTDDLLAQLAGDEIDRLLAEADADAPPPTTAGAAAAPTAAAAVPAAAPATLTPVKPGAVPPQSAAVVSPPAAPATADAVVEASVKPSAVSIAPAPAAAPQLPAGDDLDALLSELNSGVRAPVPAELNAAAAVPLPPVAPAAEPAPPKSLTEQVPEVLAQFGATVAPPSDVIPSADVPAEGLMSPAERDALRLGDLAAEADAADQQDAAAALAGDAPAPAAEPSGKLAAPAIRVLEWVNAPLSFVPDTARDVLGKVAVLTLVNSAAVLIYVLFIRR